MMWGDSDRHGEHCSCEKCNGEHEQTSAEMAGGVAVGLTGRIFGFNADAEARLDKMLTEIGAWIENDAGYFLGHVKLAIYNDDGGITLNLIDTEIGVEHHGTFEPCEEATFNFMAAVVDVDEHKLKHAAMHALEDSGVDVILNEEEHHHHHEHGENCTCGCHDEHHHEHKEECGCGCHDKEHHHHEHGKECGCHGEHHHHEHEEGCTCGCHGESHGHNHESHSNDNQKDSIWDKVRRKLKK